MTTRELVKLVLGRAGLRESRGGVLIYHGLAEASDDPARAVSPRLSAEVFAAQLRAVASSCEVVPLAGLQQRLVGRRRSFRPLVAATFDDLRSHAELAAPILRREGLPATFFLGARRSTGAGACGSRCSQRPST